MRLVVMLALSAVLAACAPLAGNSPAAEELARLMAGDFENSDAEDADYFLDRRRRLSTLGPGEWVYLQLNSGPEKRLYRQRVLQLIEVSPGVVRQRTFRLLDPTDQRDLIADPQRLSALTMADLDSDTGLDCENLWQRGPSDSRWLWQGRVDPQQCIIYSERRGQRIRIGSSAYLNRNELWLAERGFDLAVSQLWGTPPGEFARLQRQTTFD